MLASKIRVLWRLEHLRKLDLNYFRCVYVFIEGTVINRKFCQILLGGAITNQMTGHVLRMGMGNYGEVIETF